jgi:NAD(P)-dependent dehydrogenase (short-subunit alcohol dehydrogenase family)
VLSQLDRPRPLLGRVALVYDATTPAGGAAARELARLGAWTACALRERHEVAQQLVDAIRMDGGRALLLAGDPAQPREAWTLLQRLEAEWGLVELVALVPSPGDPPQQPRVMLASLLEAGVGTLANSARLLLALPPGMDAAGLSAMAPPATCVAGVYGAEGDEATGLALARLALAEPCPHGVFM